jgi:hypothetical protein
VSVLLYTVGQCLTGYRGVSNFFPSQM